MIQNCQQKNLSADGSSAASFYKNEYISAEKWWFPAEAAVAPHPPPPSLNRLMLALVIQNS